MTEKWPGYDYRYSIIPGGAVTDKRLSLRDLQVLALLGRHTKRNGWCFRSQVEMAKEISCGRATVGRSIKRLIDAGWLEAKALPRGRTVLKEGQQPFSAFRYRVVIDLPDEAAEVENDVPNYGHLPEEPPKSGQGVPTASSQDVPAQPGTHRRFNLKDQLNALAPAGAGESEKIASLGKGSPERFPEFRSTVAKTWPKGFPADNETACRKAWEHVTRLHDPTLVIACAALHGAAKTANQAKRGAGGVEMMRLPANWLKDGDWEGYIPQAEERAREDARIVSAVGNVRRALGEGVFALLRRQEMPDYLIARLDGMTLAGPAAFTVTSAFQKTLLDKHCGALERHFGERPSFTLVQPVRRTA